MKNIILSVAVLVILSGLFLNVNGNDLTVSKNSQSTPTVSDSLETFDHIPPYLGEKFIRYMHRPDKKRFNEDPGPMRYYVLEVSTDVMEGGIRRAMPFTTIVRGGEEYFVAFEVVTSFETEEEVLKYAEENKVTDIDLKGYIDVPEQEDSSDSK
jgi:hypothetical protein